MATSAPTRPAEQTDPRYSGAEAPDMPRLIAEYEDALTAALAESNLIRASKAFDRADRLQNRLLRLNRPRRA